MKRLCLLLTLLLTGCVVDPNPGPGPGPTPEPTTDLQKAAVVFPYDYAHKLADAYEAQAAWLESPAAAEVTGVDEQKQMRERSSDARVEAFHPVAVIEDAFKKKAGFDKEEYAAFYREIAAGLRGRK